MAVAVGLATAVGLAYGGCQALGENAVAVNGTAAQHLLSACVAVADFAGRLPESAGAALGAASGVPMDEWRLEGERLFKTLVLQLAGQAVLTAVLLLVRWPCAGSGASPFLPRD